MYPYETQYLLDNYCKISGDCDCLSIYINAALTRLGYKSHISVGYLYYNGIKYGHMWVSAYLEHQWCIVESTTSNLKFVPFKDLKNIALTDGITYQEILWFNAKMITKDLFISTKASACELPKPIVDCLNKVL